MPTLNPGKRIGVFEITGTLGAGGMGEVYRARDTRLRRDVALKVVPDLFADDPDRLMRFEREAQVLASLNHPHIAAIYGMEDTGAARALVMELVEGPTLADRIAHAPIPVDEALPIARQIADALETAHERGIIHRDLKPANIKLTADGTVKVLDFGLAKIFSDDTGTADPALSPTVTAGTRAGVILGTAAYMSPEQARGKQVDKRVDVWAFGCVLYEMLTGKRVFSGDDSSEILAAVLRQEIDWTTLPASTSAAVRWLLQRCLERDPKQRLHDIGDARLLLSGDFPSTSDRGSRALRTWRMAAVVAAVAVVAAAITAWMADARGTGRASPLRMLDISETTGASHPALSPDGSMVAYVRPDELWLRRFDKAAPARLVTATDIGSVTWAPSSDALAYFRGANVHIVRVDGTEDRTVWRSTPQIGSSRGDTGLVWSGDALYLPVSIAKGVPAIARVPLDGGEPTVVRPSNSAPPMTIFRYPILLDDKPTLLVNPGITPEGRPDFGTVWALRGTEAKQVLAFPETVISGMAYLPTTRVLLVAATDQEQRRALWAAPFDIERLAAGQPRPIVDGFLPSSPSLDGHIVLITGARPRLPILRRLDATGREMATAAQHRVDLRNLELAPDGQRLVYRALTTLGAPTELWMFDIARGLETLIAPIGGSGLVTWSPDGQRLAAFRPLGVGDGALDLVDASSGATRRLVSRGVIGKPTWTPDGRQVLFLGGDSGNASEILSVSTDGDGEAKPRTVARIPSLFRIALSPNGRILAYLAGPRERAVVMVTPFPRLSPRVQVSGEGIEDLLWSPNSDEVWLVQNNEIVGVPIAISSTGALTSGRARPVFKPPAGIRLRHPINGRQFTTVNGKEFWIVDQRAEGEARVTLIENVEQLLRAPYK